VAPAFLISTQRVETEADAEACVWRLRRMLGRFATAPGRAERAEARGDDRFYHPDAAEGWGLDSERLPRVNRLPCRPVLSLRPPDARVDKPRAAGAGHRAARHGLDA
jgi:hypothetical protein